MSTPSGSAPKTAQRLVNVARAAHAVIAQNRTIDWVTSERAKWVNSPQERALLYGVVRHYFSLREQLNTLLDKPLRDKDQDIYCLMLVGAYQLKYSNMPPHAVINEAVDAARRLRKPWSRGLVNAVLRKISAEKEPHTADATKTDSSANPRTEQSFDHPYWLAHAIGEDYPEQWQAILTANNTRAPMVLRINTLRIDVALYKSALTDAGLNHYNGPFPETIVLEEPIPSESLPGWQEGQVAVQDTGAQYAARVLHDALGGNAGAGLDSQTHPATDAPRILDACAAPGGKLAHLHELLGSSTTKDAHLLGIELNPERIATTQAILQRLGHETTLLQGDASTRGWWDGSPFDLILLDAPCSGTGTIRRHPDIKILLQPESVDRHAQLQLKMLNNLWQTLAPGGTLLYCTCSLLNAENDKVIGCFVDQNNKHADTLPLNLASGQPTRYGWQLLPTDPNTDGFYYALLRKR